MLGWLNSLLRWHPRTPERRSAAMTWLDTLIDVLGGGKSASGVTITHENALSIAAVFTCVRIISGTIGALPMHVYRATEDGGRDLARRHWAYALLHDSPNQYHTAMTWRELMTAHLLLWGNSYNRIEWLGNGAAAALYPLMPWSVQPKLTKGGAKFYEVRLGGAGGEELADYEVLHVPGLSYDGMQGLSVISKMRDSLGLARAAEDFAAQFFANGARIGGILETPGRMNEIAQKRLVDSIAEKYAGKADAFKVLVLEGGAKWHGGLTMPLRDAEFIELRKFQRSEIFGWYGLPPHLGGDTERSTSWGTGIEQQDIGYAKHTITPLCVRIEQELNRKLFGRGSEFYCRHNLDGLQRGDFKTRMEGLQIAVGRPFMSVNEARQLSEMNRLEAADYDQVALPLNIGVGASPTAPNPTRNERSAAEPTVVSLPAPTVNVAIENRIPPPAAPVVNVEQRLPEPSPVHVSVTLPPRRSVSEIERDHDGEITRVVQLEDDA